MATSLVFGDEERLDEGAAPELCFECEQAQLKSINRSPSSLRHCRGLVARCQCECCEEPE